MRQMMQQVAIEQILALFLQADRRIDFRFRLARHHRAEELDERGRHFHVDEKIRMREAEDDQQLLAFEQYGIKRELTRPDVMNRNRERHNQIAVDNASDNIGRLVPVEQRREHVNLEVRRFDEGAERVVNRLQYAADVALQVFERRIQLKIRDDALERLREAVLARVIRAIRGLRRRFVVFDVLGRDRGTHENEVVVEIRAVQDLAADGIEERLRAFGLAVRGQEADVVQLDLLPDFVVDVFRVVFVFEQFDAFLHAFVVRRDALAREPLDGMPV